MAKNKYKNKKNNKKKQAEPQVKENISLQEEKTEVEEVSETTEPVETDTDPFAEAEEEIELIYDDGSSYVEDKKKNRGDGRKKYTVLVIPPDGGSVRQFALSPELVVFLVALLVAIIILLVYFILY